MKVSNLFSQLIEEEFGETCYPTVVVHNARGQLTDLTFDLDHVVEDEMR